MGERIMSNMITITLNNRERQLNAGTTVRDIMNERKIRRAAIWINGSQLLKAQYDDWELKEGDKMRLIRFAGGG